MNQKVIRIFVAGLLLLTACASTRPAVPAGTIPTPRTQTIDDEQYGHAVLEQLTQEFPLDYNDPRLEKIQQMVWKLACAAKEKDSVWHIYLFRAPEVKNAAATRGNHIFIWSGLLDFVQSDDELATILGHEIAHVLAGHTDPDPNEAAREMLVSVGAIAASLAVATATKNPALGNNLGNVAGSVTQEVGRGILVNPYSKEVEFEADHIGLMLMAKAGYNPKAALTFWERAQNDPGFSSGVAFFSTHPQAEQRGAKLREALPRATEYFNGPRCYTELKVPAGQTVESVVAAHRRKEAKKPTAEQKQRADYNLNQRWPQRWTVIRNRAVMFSKPDASSNPVGEFREGAKVVAISRQGEWLEIVEPDRGWLHQSTLRRTRIPRR